MLLPPEITNFFPLPYVPELVPEVTSDELEKGKIENENGFLTLENEIHTFLEQGLEQHEEDDNSILALMASMFERVIAEDNQSLCLQI